MARAKLTDLITRRDANGVLYAATAAAAAQVNVRGGGAATVYAAATGGSTLSNPLTVTNGQLPGYVDVGQYDIVVTLPGYTPETLPVEASSGLDAVRIGTFINPMTAPYNAMGNGSTDDTTALLLASNDARNSGKKLYVPAGIYKVSTQITTSGNVNPLILHGDGPGLTEFTMAAGMTFPVIAATGALAADVAVTAPTSPGAYLVDITSTAGITPGQWVRLMDSTQPIYGLSTRAVQTYASEWARVYSVVSSTRLRLHCRLDYGYTTSATVRALAAPGRLDCRQFSIRNLTPGTLAATARGIQCTYWADCRIRDVDFTDMDATAVQLDRGVEGLVEGVHFLNMNDNETANTPYGISASSCQDVTIQHVRSRYGRHLYTAGGGVAYGVASHIYLGDCIAAEHSATGFDTHPGAIKHVFENCHVHGSFPTAIDTALPGETSGFQIRGTDTDIVECSVDNVPDHGVYLVYAADRCRVIGGRYANCNIGIAVEDSDDTFIGGDVMIQNPVTDGVVYDRNAPYAAYMSKATIGDMRVTGNPSGAGIHNNVSGLAIDYL